eukprot:scaffold36071_cov74-Phaeocystis_antarctica.AAC.4
MRHRRARTAWNCNWCSGLWYWLNVEIRTAPSGTQSLGRRTALCTARSSLALTSFGSSAFGRGGTFVRGMRRSRGYSENGEKCSPPRAR